MIVWGLASLERVGLADSALELGNVMARLKHRYDREVDGAERSVIRKITEKDEPSARLEIFIPLQFTFLFFLHLNIFPL